MEQFSKWNETASQEQKQSFVQTKSLLDAKEYSKAKEEIHHLIELLGGEVICKQKGYHDVFYLRGEAKSGSNELCHEDFLTAFQISNPKNIQYVKRAAIECQKEYARPHNITLTSALEWAAADPNNIEAKVVLLEGCDVQKYLDENIQTIRQSVLDDSLKEHPDHPHINYHYALHNQFSPNTIPNLIKAVDAIPEKKTWRQRLISCLKIHQSNELKQKLLKYLLLEVEDDPKNVTKLEDLAKGYESVQRWSEALETRKKIVAMDPSSARRRQKLEIEPLEKLVKNTKLGIETAESRRKKVQQMIHLGYHVSEPALEIATQLVKENPEDNRFKVLRLDVLWLGDQSSEVFNQIKEIHEVEKSYWRTHFLLGCCYERNHLNDLSLEHYRRANKLKPMNYRILKRKIAMERFCGDDRVLKDYDDFFRFTPEFSDLPSYMHYVQDLRLWKKALEGIHLAQKEGLQNDFSRDLEYCKKHQQLDEGIENQPSASSYEARGDVWLSEGKPALAFEDLKKASELSPNNANLLVKIGTANIGENKHADALQVLTRAIFQDPNNAEAFYQRSLCPENTTKLEDAEKACELVPGNIAYWKQLKSLNREADRIEEAVKVIKKVIEMTTTEEVRLLKSELGECYQELNQWQEAVAVFRELGNQDFASKCDTIDGLRKTAPTDNLNQIAQVYEKIVDIMTNMNRSKAAYKMIKNLVQSEPYSKCAGLYGILATMARSDNDIPTAHNYSKRASELEPKNPQWVVTELETYQRILWDTATEKEKFIDKAFLAVSLGGTFSAQMWQLMISIAMDLKKNDLVLKMYDDFYVKLENTEKSLNEKALFCEVYMKNFQEALNCYVRACEINPSCTTSWSNRALVLNKMGKYTEAFRCAQKAIELDPTVGQAYAAVAMVYLSQGKLLEAKEYAEKGIRMNSFVPCSYLVFAQILEQKQQFLEAKANYEKFLSMFHPDEDLVKLGQEGLARCENRITLEQQQSKNETQHHLFLSHYQRTGGLLAMVLKLLLEQADPTLKIFLDTDDLENIDDLKSNVNHITENSDWKEGVFERRFVVEEITTALELGKNIILIWDKERCPWPDPKIVSERLHKVLLVSPIIWNAEKVFRNVVVQQIASKITRTDQSQIKTQLLPPQQAHQLQASISSEQFDEIRNSMQQQFDVCKHILQQNELLQQTLTHLQTNFMQLQQKVVALSNQTSFQVVNQPPAQPIATQSPTVTAEPPKPEPTAVATSEGVPRKLSTIEPSAATPQELKRSSTQTNAPKTRADSVPVQNNNSASSEGKTRVILSDTPPSPFKQIYTMEGWLHKLGGWNKTKWESRYFTVDTTAMIYHESQQIIQVSSPKGCILLKEIISVEEVHYDVYRVNNCFAIQTPSKKYFFYADDEVAKVKWISALKKK